MTINDSDILMDRPKLEDAVARLARLNFNTIYPVVYRPELQSFLEHISRPELEQVRQKIPTGVGILTGLRNKPMPMQLIQAKVLSARERRLGVSFFFYESLWNSAPEPESERQSNFQALFPFPASRPVVQQPSTLPI